MDKKNILINLIYIITASLCLVILVLTSLIYEKIIVFWTMIVLMIILIVYSGLLLDYDKTFA